MFTQIEAKDIILLAAGSIIGIITSYLFYVKAKQVKSLAYTSTSQKLLSKHSGLDKIHISYQDRSVSNIYRVRYFLWNSGNQTVDKTEISPINPLRILKDILSENTFLDVVVAYSRPENNLVIKDELDSIIIIFDFLDPKDGVSIDVYYEQNITTDLFAKAITGTIKGIRKISQVPYEYSIRTTDLIFEPLKYSLLGGPLGAIMLYAAFEGNTGWNTIIAAIIGAIFSIGAIVGFCEIIFTFFALKIPKQLKRSLKDANLI